MIAPDHTKQIAHRIVQARTDFLETLRDLSGCTEEEAAKVFDLYRSEKIIKLDAVHGRYSVKHGGFLDSDVIRRAIDSLSPATNEGEAQ